MPDDTGAGNDGRRKGLFPGTVAENGKNGVAGPGVSQEIRTLTLIYPLFESGNYITKDSTSKMYNYIKSGFIENSLIDDDLLWDSIQYLESKSILKPVARLRPFATLKGPKPKIN